MGESLTTKAGVLPCTPAYFSTPIYHLMKTPKVKIQLIIATAATLFGIVLIAVAILLPPAGYIDPTVLTAYGETLTFAGALIGVDYHYRSKS